MHRWLYFAVSCTAAIGIACGGDSGDGTKFDARPTIDGGGAVDARPVDAAPPTIDARPIDAPPPVVFDARPDAPPPVVFDAGPDAPPPVVVDAGPDAPPACVSDPGCTAAGTICTDADHTATCAAVTGNPTCFKYTATPLECAGVSVCNAGACVCPAPVAPANAAVGLGCAQLNQQACSADSRSILTCVNTDSCNVWAVSNPTTDVCQTADGTGDGLTCSNNQCVCPPNPTSIFFANPVVDRTARPGLVRNGLRIPALCSFDTLTLALGRAAAPEFAETGVAVAAADSPSATNAGKPARFENENFPMSIPPGRTLTTTDDPLSGIGGSGNFVPQNFVIVVNKSHDAEASVIVNGTNVRGGRDASLRGVTVVEGNCTTGSDCYSTSTAVLVTDVGNPAAGSQPLNSILVEGGGGAIADQGTGNVTATVDGDLVDISVAGEDNANIFADVGPGNWVGIVGPAGTDPNMVGFFLIVDKTDGNTVTVKNPNATADATITGAQVAAISGGGWSEGVRFETANGTVSTVVVRDFASLGGDSNRIGLHLVSDFPGDGPEASPDVISVQGGLFYMNDTAIAVNGAGDVNASIGPFASAGGPVPVTITNSQNAGLHANTGTTVATGVVESSTTDGNGAVGFLVTGGDVSLNGVSGTANQAEGLLYIGGLLIDNGSTFTANNGDGVTIGQNEAAKPQAVEANVELRNSVVTNNKLNGINIVGGQTVSLRSVTVTGNALDGVNQSGDASLIINGVAGDAVARLNTNGDSGLEATNGSVQAANAEIIGNGTADRCEGTNDRAADAVIISGNGTVLNATGINVKGNRGGGVTLTNVAATNTIEGSNIEGNLGVDNCGGGNSTNAAIHAGVNVAAGSRVDFVNAASSVQLNSRAGIYNAGVVNAPVALTILGNAWTGAIVAAGGSMTQTAGTVNNNGRGTGAGSNTDGVFVAGSYASTGTEYLQNKGSGVAVNSAAASDRTILTLPSIHNNDGNGVTVTGAPGSDSANVDALSPVADEDYGFVIRYNGGAKASVFSNGGAGLSFGSASQTHAIVAKVGDTNIFSNAGAGLTMRQASAQGVGAACDGPDSGCTGVTILSNRIFNNTGSGLVIGTSFIKRLVGGVEQRGFAANDIFHNGLATCAGPQTAPQIVVNGATALVQGVCDDQLDADNCYAQNNPVSGSNDNPGINNQCMFAGGACTVAFDLSSSPTTCDLANSIRDYLQGSTPERGGLRATNGAKVLADRNNWVTNPPASQSDYNVSADAGTFIKADLACTQSNFQCIENRQ